jgi:integrase
MKKTLIPEARWDDNRHYWKINVQRDGIRRSFYSSEPGRKGKREAEGKAAEWLTCQTGSDLRLSVAVDRYLAQREKLVQVNTSEKAFFNNYVLPKLGGKMLSRICLNDWNDLIVNLADQGRRKSTLALYISCIERFCKYCKANRYPIEVPENILIPTTAEGKKEKNALQPEHIRILFSQGDSWYIHAFRFCVLLGLRRGELAGLQWFDITDNVLTVSRSIRPNGDISHGKNENAHRKIVLPALAQHELKEQKLMLAQAKVVSPYIFCNSLGKPVLPNNLYELWKGYCKSNGIPQLSFHEIRHTFISATKADMPEELLKQVVGHSATMDTFGTYGHAMSGDAERAATITDTVFRDIIGS